MASSSKPAHHERPRWHWWIILLAAVLGLVLGTLGCRQYYDDIHRFDQVHISWLSCLYRALQLFVFKGDFDRPINPTLEFARWIAAASLGLALWSGLAPIYREEWRRFLLGFASGHLVLCGDGRGALKLARQLRTAHPGDTLAVVAPEPSAEMLAALRELSATVIVGQATDPANLRAARAEHARLLLVAEDDDRANTAVAVGLQALMREPANAGRGPLTCHVRIGDLELRRSFQRNQILQDLPGRLTVHFFDPLESSARRLLLEVLPLDHGGIAENSPARVHLVILGFGLLGRTVAVQAAQLGHLANRQRLQISVIDRFAARHEQTLLFRYPQFRQVCDVDFHSLEAESLATREKLEAWLGQPNVFTHIAVCFDQDSLGLDLALNLLPNLQKHQAPIAVRMSGDSGLATLLNNETAPEEIRQYIRTFGVDGGDPARPAYDDPEQDTLARLIHLRFIEKGETHDRQPELDASMRNWGRLPEDYKDANRQQATHLPIKLHAIGCEIAAESDRRDAAVFLPAEIELLSEMEHARWAAERLLAGWSFFDGPKDEILRTNRNIQPWAKLKDDIKDYDRDTIRNIPYILKQIGKKACRK